MVIVEDGEDLVAAVGVTEAVEEGFQEAVVEVSFTFLRARIVSPEIDSMSQILPCVRAKFLEQK